MLQQIYVGRFSPNLFGAFMNQRVEWGPKIQEQFERQARWTRDFREQIYRKVGLKKAKRILEVGCGTGVITEELREKTSAEITAIDHDKQMIELARRAVQGVEFLVEDAHNLTLKSNKYDLIFFQYFLLWVKNPSVALEEITRVCKKGGNVIALAEPDYGSWIEYPEYGLGEYHRKSLEKEGADPDVGRKLLYLFEGAGLRTEISVIGQIWSQENLLDNIKEEWRRVLEAGLIDSTKFEEMVKLEKKTILENKRMIFIPVFYAIGTKR